MRGRPRGGRELDAADARSGTAVAPVTGLADVHGQMFFFKATARSGTSSSTTDNVPVFTGAEESAQRRTTGATRPLAEPACTSASGGGFYRLTAAGSAPAQIERVGPERLVTNTSPVRGAVRAFAGCATLLRLRRRLQPRRRLPGRARHVPGAPSCCATATGCPREGDEEGVAQFVDAYDGALVAWPDKKISALGVCTSPAVAAGRPAEAGQPPPVRRLRGRRLRLDQAAQERAQPLRPRPPAATSPTSPASCAGPGTAWTRRPT